MYLFHNDYNETCHPAILAHIAEMQNNQYPGYGMDAHCEHAATLIREKCVMPDLDVHFLCGGTQANLTVIASLLRPHQAAVCAKTGHIHVHETGAIEASGHKVITLDSDDGKLTAQQVAEIARYQLSDENAEHSVQAKLVYISNPTELGTTYTLEELTGLANICREYGLYLYMDGARLGYALTAVDNDVTLSDIARLCDVFYIGGTKVGAMFGEAVVFSNSDISADFRYMIKQRGGMLAKGWLLGAQFEALFENDLYFTIARHANAMADILRDQLCKLGYDLFYPGATNQVFALLPNSVLSKLSEMFTYMLQEKIDDSNSVVRFCTSWATTQESIDALCNALVNISR